MNKEILKKLHDAELEILDEIARVCDENNIKYFILFGTLLGAVRHKGFIPWDDDIDIGMLREDYTKFLEIAPKEIKQKFFLDNINNSDDWYLNFSKVKNRNTIFEEELSLGFNGSKNIFVDIFPIDYVKDDHLSKKLIFKQKLVGFLNCVMCTNTFKKKENKKALFVSKFMSNKMAAKIIDKICISKRKTDYLMFFGFDLSDAFFANKNIFLPLKKMDFEGKKYYAPRDHQAVLTLLYGKDYMELPPIEKRVTHKPVKIEFEKEK